MSPAARDLTDDCSGVVFVEFLIAFVPMWVFFLCVAQMALIARANLLVRHAADCAARSAVVVLPDDPAEYAGEPEMSLQRKPLTPGDITEVIRRLSDSVGRSIAGSGALAQSSFAIANPGRSRLDTIRLAAYVPLAPLAPRRFGIDPRPSLREAIGDGHSLLAAIAHHPVALAVTFPGATGDVATGPEITVRVTYAYQCAVPLARRLLCRSFRELPSRGDYEQSLLPVLASIATGRFRELQHETTLMIHDAPYRYRGRGS
jgi:hypothetical protein